MAEPASPSRPYCTVFLLTLFLLPGGLSAPAQAAPQTVTVSAEDLYEALLKPSLADDGRISSAERQAILAVARKVLNEPQVIELERRIAAHTGEALPPTPAAVSQNTAPALALELPAPLLSPTFGECPAEGLLDNVSLFLGLDGSKQPQDLGVNANLGGRFAVNGGFPLWRAVGLGVQVGTALGYSDHAVHVLDQVEGTHERFQSFTTVGVFQRTAWGLTWGVAYDFQADSYYDDFDLGQWRGRLGYAMRETDELGVWFAVKDHGDNGHVGKTAVRLDPIDQANLFWRHTWPNVTQTTAWAGIAEGHSEAVLVFPPNPRVDAVLTFGAEIHVPLNDWLAIYGSANFITPAATGTVDAFLGVTFYPGGGARQVHRHRFAPVLPVAGNPSFAVDSQR